MAIVLSSFSIQAQCLTKNANEFKPTTPTDCFDIDEIMANCTPIYMKVNLHYFLDDNCEGDLAMSNDQQHIDAIPNGLQPNVADVYEISEAYITEANFMLEHMSNNYPWEHPQTGELHMSHHMLGQAEHGITPTDPPCIPIRYTLSGVYVHCDTNIWNGIPWDTPQLLSLFTPYEVNPSEEINVFITGVLPNSAGQGGDGSGLASTLDAPEYSTAVVETFGVGLFNHEMAHIFGLDHCFSAQGNMDNCPDLWDASLFYEAQCDGVITWGLNSQGVPTGEECYNIITDPTDCNAICPDGSPNPHPCCEWPNINNNLMNYSALAGNLEYSALTPCQVNKMLEDIRDNLCDQIHQIGDDCSPPTDWQHPYEEEYPHINFVPSFPPPTANIGILPEDQILGSDCMFCFNLQGSMNEESFQLVVNDSFGTEVFDSGIVNQEAGVICLDVLAGANCLNENSGKLIIGGKYQAELTVQNDCSDHTSNIAFELPRSTECGFWENSCSGSPTALQIDVSPNPSDGIIRFNFKAPVGGLFSIYTTNANTYSNPAKIYERQIDEGRIESFVDLSFYPKGNHYLLFEIGNYLGSVQIELQ